MAGKPSKRLSSTAPSAEAQLLAALLSEPQRTGALVETISADVPAAMHALAERSLLAGLIKPEDKGRVRRNRKPATRSVDGFRNPNRLDDCRHVGPRY